MTNSEILKSYLDALGFDSKLETLEDITKLIKAHLRIFPFASLKVLLKEEILLDLYSIYENIVLKKRGGYCFEHNKLLYEVLKELGFNVTYYLARVVNNTDAIPPQTHRFTLLELEEEKYLIDVGIGFRTPSVPIKFGDDVSISHLDTAYKVIENNDTTYSMQLIQKGKPFIATKFDLTQCYETDFEMGHFYSHKHPDAIFVNNFVISIIQEDAIYSLVNNQYLKISKNNTEKIEIENIEAFNLLLKKQFNCNFSDEEIAFFYERFIR